MIGPGSDKKRFAQYFEVEIVQPLQNSLNLSWCYPPSLKSKAVSFKQLIVSQRKLLLFLTILW